MKIIDILSMGFRNLLRRKTRTFLTVIGVVVGATAIVIMLSLGIGMNENLNKSIENMGDLTIIDLQSYASKPSGDTANSQWISAQNNLDDALIKKICGWDGVLAVTPYMQMYSDSFDLHAGSRYKLDWASVTGIDSSFLPYLKLNVERGYMPQPGDTNFIIFGKQVSYMFRDPNKNMSQKDQNAFYNPDLTKPPKIDILTQRIYLQGKSNNYTYDPVTGMQTQTNANAKFKKYYFDKVGILKYVDTRGYGYDENAYNIFVDYHLVIELQKEIEKANKVKAKDSKIGKYDWVKIKVKNLKTSETIQKKLEDEGIMLSYSLADIRDEMQKSQNAVQMILGGIGAMSLIVAAIGIANTMFMSIYERTKEIGVMKVLGCPLFGIRSMFLFESSIIGCLGGILGSGLSFVGSYAMNNIDFIKKALGNMSGTGGFYYGGNTQQGDISVIPLWLILVAVIFSTVVGLVSGYLPARRATKISALEAIRNE
ncbi:MAG: ABC transporter permease [Oscillospiraceae bacterium]|nr:ABC transporter permease [Oscillospiraceae bacterium]